MSVLLKDKFIRDNYSKQVNGNILFDFNSLIDIFRYKNFWQDSYTKFSNKIGLTSNGQYLNYNSNVVLDFPFKDTVIKGRMTKEDNDKDNFNEPFLNEVISRDQINEMFEPKVLSNAKKYDSNGEHQANNFTNQDNLILKGNNLIALHSLKKRYAGKVKLIYIDPPYNTGNDSFEYNDRYNQSTWLTFMKNRLEIAREMLSNNGSVWINIDQNEHSYLKVLCDEIFGKNNFIADIIWKKKFSPQNDAQYFSDMHDYILVYSKDKSMFKVNGLPRNDNMNSRYKNIDNDPRGPWTSGDLSVKTYNSKDDYSIKTPSGNIINPPKGRCWRTSKEKFLQLVKDNRIWFGKNGNNVPRLKRFLSDVKQTVTPQTIWDYSEVGHNQDAVQELKNVFNGRNLFNTPKPEALLKRILTIGSNKNDIILDFFMGSATTQAVSMKMHRRFIGVEQMDYINNVSVPRLQKVIAGEPGGVSKDTNWHGGGSFVYAELMDKNQQFINFIQQTTNKNELNDAHEYMKKHHADLDVHVDLNAYEDEKNAHSFIEQRNMLIQMINKNQLYYNYHNLDDKNLNRLLSDEDYHFNKSFYSTKGGKNNG